MSCISHLPRAHGPRRPDRLTGLREGLIRNGGAKSRFEMSRGFPTIQSNLIPIVQDLVAASADIGLNRK
jgi:hypothetical protein